MSWRLIFDNLVAYSMQIGMLVGVAAVIPTVLRLRQPGAKLVYWQILLAACLLLPLQPWRQAISAGRVEVTTTITAVQPVHRSPSPQAIPRSEMALLVVLAGMAIRLGWLAIGFWKLRRYRRLSRHLEPAPAWSVEAALLLSDEIASPVTFGWRKPVVLLPANFPALDAQVQDAILCHEVMHVRRGDWLFTVAEELVRTIFWFHPAIWWLLGEIGLAREQEVDRLAIEITHEREQYMDALLAIAGARSQLDLAPAPLFLRKRHLRNRVILILQEGHMSKTRLISTLTTGLAVLVAACWLVTGAFPLTAEPQVVSDPAGVTVNLNGSTVLHRTTVHYPAAALQRGEQGSVTVEVKLDANGNVSDARVLSGPDDLRPAVLESVLEWHFTRDAAGSTRVVEVGFELPTKGVVEGVIGGVPGGIVVGLPGGVLEGVPGRVVAGFVSGDTELHFVPASSRILSIQVAGLSDESRAAILATLPIHEGDKLTEDAARRTNQAIQEFDEHLTMRAIASSQGVVVRIIAPGVAPPPPPPPPSALAALQNPPEKIKVGGNVQSAMIVTKVPPLYPALAKMAGVQGAVHLAVLVGKDGTVQEIHLLDGPSLLVQAAMDAVKQWVYKPTFLNGEPVAVETTIDVNFTLNQ